MRITEKMLKSRIDYLNIHSRYHYCYYSMNGWYYLAKECEFGGVETVASGATKSELFYKIAAIISYNTIEGKG